MNPALLLLADGRFPAGGHTNSAGVEAAVALGGVHDEATVETYLRGRLATTGLVDAAFAAATVGLAVASSRRDDRSANRSGPGRAHSGSAASLARLAAEYDARVLSPHLRTTSRTFGRQLLRAGGTAWAHPFLDDVAATPGGPHQPMVLGGLVVACAGTPTDAASIVFHHLASAVTTAAVRLLGLDPMAVAAVQARAADFVARYVADADAWAATEPADLPADGGALTEILGDDHGRWDARLFVA